MSAFTNIELSIAVFLMLLASAVRADTVSIGPNGINSVGLGLTGAGVVIGQVEQGRPGDTNNGDNAANSNTTTGPADVFEQANPGNPSQQCRY